MAYYGAAPIDEGDEAAVARALQEGRISISFTDGAWEKFTAAGWPNRRIPVAFAHDGETLIVKDGRDG
jgi:hypothetical protein